MIPLKTPAVARLLGVTYHRVMSLIRFDKITHPQRDSSGDYAWLPEDVERARLALTSVRPQAREVARV